MANTKRGVRPVSSPARGRPPRADATANRARLLEVAAEAFDQEGLAVSLDEIARRAGLGAGTVHRHFPTKAALIDATVAERVRSLAADVQARTGAEDPTAALFEALTLVVERGAASHALADRLRDESDDIDAAVAEPVAELWAALRTLLGRAQEAGGVRRDLDVGSLDAVVAAAHVLEVHPSGGDHLVELLLDGLRPPGPSATPGVVGGAT
jgi:AcrR family transcriptional regulator